MSHRGAIGSSPMANAEEDVLACMIFPAQHRAKLHSTNPTERLNGKIKRRTDVVGVRAFLWTDGSHALTPQRGFDPEIGGAILMEQTEEWTVQRSRYMTLETLMPVCDDAMVSLPAAQHG